MTKWLKKELKKASKDKKRCAKLYSDWKDDEFNCSSNKFIFGVMSENGFCDVVPSFYTLNDLQVYYNRDTEKYLLDIDCNLLCLNSDSYIKRLNTLLKRFKCFMIDTFGEEILNNNLSIETSADFVNDYWSTDDLLTLYRRFYIFVSGYKQLVKSIKVKENNNK